MKKTAPCSSPFSFGSVAFAGETCFKRFPENRRKMPSLTVTVAPRNYFFAFCFSMTFSNTSVAMRALALMTALPSLIDSG